MDILDSLGVEYKAIIIQAVGFLILLFILKKYLFGKISAMLNERSEGVKKVYTKVENDRAEAERLKIEYHKKISEAEAEAVRRVQEAVNEGSRISEEIIKRAKEEIELMKGKAQDGIELERKKALADIRNQVVTLSIMASSRLIRQSISTQTAERLVDDFIEEIGELRVR